MKKGGDWLPNLLRIISAIGIIFLVVWFVGSCLDESEEKAAARRAEEDAELVRQTEERVWEEVYDKLPPLEDILSDAYNPDEMLDDLKDGVISEEDIYMAYVDLYEAIHRELHNNDLY